MFFKRQKGVQKEEGIAESIKKDLVATLQKRGIQVADIHIDITQENFSIHLQGVGKTSSVIQ